MSQLSRSDASVIGNLAEDLDSAQMILDDGNPGMAKAYVEASLTLFHKRLPRAKAKVEYALGKCHCTVTLDGQQYILKSINRARWKEASV